MKYEQGLKVLPAWRTRMASIAFQYTKTVLLKEVASSGSVGKTFLKAPLTQENKRPQEESDLVLLQAMTAYEKKEYSAAASFVDTVLKGRKASFQSHFLMATIQISLENIDLAIFHFKESVRIKPDFGWGHASLAYLLTLSRQWKEAEPHIRKALKLDLNTLAPFVLDLCLMQVTYAQRKTLEGAFDFSPLFVPSDVDKAFSILPSLEVDVPPELLDKSQGEKTIIFCACDSGYFTKHALSAFYSYLETESSAYFHFHLYSPVESDLKKIQNLRNHFPRLSFSYEEANLHLTHPRLYYSTLRFCRLFQIMNVLKGHRFFMIDADVLFRHDVHTIKGFHNAPMGLTYLLDEPMWDQFSGSSSYYTYHPIAITFLQYVSLFIIHNIRVGKARWFLDQVALYATYGILTRKEQVELLDPESVLDLNFTEGSVLWAVADEKENQDAYNKYKKELNAKYASYLGAVNSQ